MNTDTFKSILENALDLAQWGAAKTPWAWDDQLVADLTELSKKESLWALVMRWLGGEEEPTLANLDSKDAALVNRLTSSPVAKKVLELAAANEEAGGS